MDEIWDLSLVKALFDKYDTKKKKALDLAELESLFFDVLTNLGEKNPEKQKFQIAKEGLEIFDKNKNGTIEFNEFSDIIDFLILEKGYDLSLK